MFTVVEEAGHESAFSPGLPCPKLKSSGVENRDICFCGVCPFVWDLLAPESLGGFPVREGSASVFSTESRGSADIANMVHLEDGKMLLAMLCTRFPLVASFGFMLCVVCEPWSVGFT